MDYKTTKEEIEKKFNQTKSQLDGVNNQARQLSEELMRIQGEFRLIAKLEAEELNTKTKSNEQTNS